MDLFLKQSCPWHWRKSMLHYSCFLCSASGTGDKVTCQHAGCKGAWKSKCLAQSWTFQAVRLRKEAQTLGSQKEQQMFFTRGHLYFCWVTLFSQYGNRLHSDLLWKPSLAYKILMLFSPFILCHSAPLFCFNYRGSNKAFAAVSQKWKIIYWPLLD